MVSTSWSPMLTTYAPLGCTGDRLRTFFSALVGHEGGREGGNKAGGPECRGIGWELRGGSKLGGNQEKNKNERWGSTDGSMTRKRQGRWRVAKDTGAAFIDFLRGEDGFRLFFFHVWARRNTGTAVCLPSVREDIKQLCSPSKLVALEHGVQIRTQNPSGDKVGDRSPTTLLHCH